jgi:hypothetical protein
MNLPANAAAHLARISQQIAADHRDAFIAIAAERLRPLRNVEATDVRCAAAFALREIGHAVGHLALADR